MENLARPVRGRGYPTFPGHVTNGPIRVDGVVRNLTAGGAMFESEHELTSGDQVCLFIQGFGWIAGSVAWSIDGRTGVKFDAPLP